MKIIEVFKGENVIDGTFQVLKNLEKLGVLKIVEVRSYDRIECYDSFEDLESYFETFEAVIDIVYGNPIDGFSKNGFIERMISGLGVNVIFERIA